MTEVMEVFRNCYSRKEEYCVLCMRSGKERRMVNLKNLEAFAYGAKLPFNYTYDFQRICFVCSRAAATAHRVRLALNMSTAVHHLFRIMARSEHLVHNVDMQLMGDKPLTCTAGQVREYSARLASVRAGTVLLQTDVLSIDTSQNLTGSDAGSCADVYVIPDAAPGDLRGVPQGPNRVQEGPGRVQAGHKVQEGLFQDMLGTDDTAEITFPDVLAEPEIYMDSVVIIDEENDPIEIKNELPDPTPTPTPTTTIVPLEQLLETETTSFLLHPIVETNGVMSVPSMSAQILNGQLVTVNNSSFTVQTPKLAVQNGSNLELLTDPEKVTTVLKAMTWSDTQNVSVICEDNEQSYMVSSTINDIHVPTVPPLNPLLQAKEINQYITPPLLQAKQINQNITNNRITEDNVKCVKRRLESKEETGKRGKEGCEEEMGSSKGTDWEDKIPMDVISFMDATDPNAPPITAPERGPLAAPIIPLHHLKNPHIGPSNGPTGPITEPTGPSRLKGPTRRFGPNRYNDRPKTPNGSNETITKTGKVVTKPNARTVTRKSQPSKQNITVTESNPINTLMAALTKVTGNSDGECRKSDGERKKSDSKLKKSDSETSKSVHQNVFPGRRGRQLRRKGKESDDMIVIDLC